MVCYLHGHEITKIQKINTHECFGANLEFFSVSLVLLIYKNAFSGTSQTIPGGDSELNSGDMT